jgi:hypothetical protein
MTPVMSLEHARAVRHNPTATRTELAQALEVLDAELERQEAHALDRERVTALQWRAAPRLYRRPTGGDAA